MNHRHEDATIESRLVRVRGLVQGVGYRYACVRRAQSLGLTGWVRNRTDNSVELLIQGSPQQLDVLCGWLRHGVPGARVDEMEVGQVQPPSPRLQRFERRPTV